MKLSVLKIFTALASVGLSSLALADPIYLGTPAPVAPIAGPVIPGPTQVPGKEYTDFLDEDFVGTLDPLQNVAWDGLGFSADSDDFDGAFPTNIDAREIDATANLGDALFDEVVTDLSALLVSVEGDPSAISVWSHARTTGAVAVWAPQLVVDSGGHIEDLDALEVWGPDLVDDSNRLSLLGDPGGVAIWDCVLGGAPACTPTVGATTSLIAMALALSGLDAAYAVLPNLADLIDLDALMYDENDGTDDTDDRALFSLRPIADPTGLVTILDGGEVFVWTVGAVGPGSISYLLQGGHLWDRLHCVACEFGAENVDALEAVSTIEPVPEPGTLALIAAGMLGLGLRRRRSA